MSDGTFRVIELAQIAVLLSCGAYLIHGYRRAIPRPLFIAGLAYGLVIVAICLAVGVNIAKDVPVTPGAVAGFFFLLFPTTVVFFLTVWVMLTSATRPRDRRRHA